MRCSVRVLAGPFLGTALLAVPLPAQAVDGVIEINQARAEPRGDHVG